MAGSVKVVNRTNLLSSLQALEYIEGLNMVRAAQGFFRLVNIIPGPIGVFRKRALEKVGGYDHDTFAEDCDLTLQAADAGLADPVRARRDRLHRGAREAPRPAEAALPLDARDPAGDLKHKRALRRSARGVGITLTLWYMIFEGIALARDERASPTCSSSSSATRYGTALPLVLWWAQLTVLDLAAALYCVVVEEERPAAACRTRCFYRAFFALTIDVAKLFATARGAAQAAHGLGQARADRAHLRKAMEIVPILSTVILVATIVTILLALFSYLAYRVRERKRPQPQGRPQAAEPRFFRRYRLPS